MSEVEKCIKNEKEFFWASYVIYIILGIAMIILTGMVLMGGDKDKGILWTVYAMGLLAFIGSVISLAGGHKILGGILLFLTLVLNLSALIMTNTVGNVVAVDPMGQYSTTGKYTAAVVLTIITFLIGMPAVYFGQAIKLHAI